MYRNSILKTVIIYLNFHFVANLPSISDKAQEELPKHSPNANGVMNTKLWKFKVKYESKDAEKVCITGNCDSLGNWKEECMIPLSYDKSAKLWYLDVKIPADRDVHYRYFTCTSQIMNEHTRTMINQWETSFKPRKVKRESTLNDSIDEYDEFGIVDNVEKLENGWLTDDVAIYIRMNSKSIEWISENISHRKTFIQVKRREKNNSRKPWEFDKNGDIIMITSGSEDETDNTEQAAFMIRTFTFDSQELDFELTDHAEGEETRYFSSLVLQRSEHGSRGRTNIPILDSDKKHVGNLHVTYLIVRPAPATLEFSFKSSFAKYWDNSWTGLEIGHRGAGKSFSNSTTALLNVKHRENTINSFKAAGDSGAHLIEFDVQLTSDLVPTVFHDFNVVIEEGSSDTKKIVPFYEIKFEELQQPKKIRHVKEIDKEVIFENNDGQECTPFPSLKHVLNSVDPQIGFDIEIKHTSQSQDGGNVDINPIDMNEYVDRVLEVVYENAGHRYIVFSSFSQDICLMARLKQNKYPVMYLTNSVKTPSPSTDERAKNIQVAIDFAKSADLLGIVAAAEDLLPDLKLVKMITDSNLIPFSWGEAVNNKENIELLKKNGVHGVIFDGMDQFGQKLKKEIFLRENDV